MNKPNLTLSQCIDKYIQDRPDLSPSTLRGYQIIKRNRFQSVMNVPVKAVRDWQAVYNADAARLSAKTMSNTWTLVKSACEHCGYSLPRITPLRMHRNVSKGFLSHDEILRFVSESRGEKYRIAFLLGLHSLRLSEVLALTWSDIDLEKNTISVHRSAVLDDKNHLTIREQTKTDLSTRTIPIFIPELAAELKRRKKYRAASDRIVSVMPNTIYRAVSTFLKKNQFEQGGFHLLRHSFASLCYYLNVPVLVTCTLGGWSDYNTVYRIYTHLERAKIAQSESELTAFFAPKQTENGSKSEKIASKKSLKINGKQALSDGGSTPPISTKKALELLDFLRDYIEYSH